MTTLEYHKKSSYSKMPNQADSISSPFFVEPKLYVTDFHYSVSEEDLKVPFKDVELISVEIRNTTPISAVLNFATIDHAEKAFAIYNNSKLETYHNKTYLKLLINDPANASHVNEPSSNAYILQVKQLDIKSTTNFTLYDEFRKFGPLFSCRLQYQDNKFRGYALVQFFKQSDAEKAAETMHYTMLGGRNIQVQFHTKSNNNNNNVPKIRTNVANHAAPASPSPEAPFVDPCNLFIKNLDANISSSDLFNHFRKFGRIISARVMRDQETGNSKGFGFVSYTTAEEADKAKSSMHGKTLGTKQIVVRLHEPKKLREAKLANHFNGSPASPSESRAPSRRNSDFYNINTINEFGQEDLSGLAPKARREVLMSELQKRFKSIPSVPSEEVNPIIDHLLNLKVTDVLLILKDAPLLQQKVKSLL
ncbi:12428_t:CDS:2 [Funneliformis mosseae]|uniref:12428_t:CDS:1 n=1 Tax=Funneliformis mosseae TaxID=27381 RepID=A0A9N9AQ55_FUNMO|nr:12428_t:CDS:2 [Funneliformis mosseae]